MNHSPKRVFVYSYNLIKAGETYQGWRNSGTQWQRSHIVSQISRYMYVKCALTFQYVQYDASRSHNQACDWHQPGYHSSPLKSPRDGRNGGSWLRRGDMKALWLTCSMSIPRAQRFVVISNFSLPSRNLRHKKSNTCTHEQFSWIWTKIPENLNLINYKYAQKLNVHCHSRRTTDKQIL